MRKLVQSTSCFRDETLCPLNSVHVALTFCVLGSKVCDAEKVLLAFPPCKWRCVKAGLLAY